jgi:hypothetical protein
MAGSRRTAARVGVMSWEAKKYHAYARECARLAEQAETVEKRNKLLELARVWLDAAIIEEQIAAEGGALPQVAWAGHDTQ